MRARRLPLALPLGLAGAFVAARLLADSNQLDTMVSTVSYASQSWLARVLPEAHGIYVSLAGLELVLMTFGWAYLFLSGKLNAGGMLSTAIQKIIFLGLLIMTLQFFPLFVPKILATFETAGGDVAGIRGLSPTALLDQGIYLASLIVYNSDYAGFIDPWAVATSLLLSALLFTCFALLAWRMTSLLIEANILLGGGALFLGFGASRFTVQLAENYIVSLIRLGIHTYLILFMVAVGNQLVPLWGDELSAYLFSVDGFAVLFRIAGEVLIFTLITLRLPSRLAYELTAPSGFLHLRQSLLGSQG
ncbi:MAG TPA: type IV secretion system protein [Thermoanaerobaculia bacterium]|nr:type IV secretion system protein [Thermoanaerobaculia bacterium]